MMFIKPKPNALKGAEELALYINRLAHEYWVNYAQALGLATEPMGLETVLVHLSDLYRVYAECFALTTFSLTAALQPEAPPGFGTASTRLITITFRRSRPAWLEAKCSGCWRLPSFERIALPGLLVSETVFPKWLKMPEELLKRETPLDLLASKLTKLAPVVVTLPLAPCVPRDPLESRSASGFSLFVR